jgi:hypothetical protein
MDRKLVAVLAADAARGSCSLLHRPSHAFGKERGERPHVHLHARGLQRRQIACPVIQPDHGPRIPPEASMAFMRNRAMPRHHKSIVTCYYKFFMLR